MAKDPEISDRMERIEAIIEQLDSGDCPPDEGSTLYQEAQQLLTEIQNLLEEGDGEIIEIE